MVGPSPRPLPDNTQRSQETNNRDCGWLRTRSPSQRAAADPPRCRDHLDRFYSLYVVRLGVSVLGSSGCCHICVFMCVHEHKCVQVNTNSHIWNAPQLFKRSSIKSLSYPPQDDFSKMSYLKQHFRNLISRKYDSNINKREKERDPPPITNSVSCTLSKNTNCLPQSR